MRFERREHAGRAREMRLPDSSRLPVSCCTGLRPDEGAIFGEMPLGFSPRKRDIMNALTRWDPLKDLDDLQSRLATIFGRTPFTPLRFEPGLKETMTFAEWTPLVDVVEDEKEYLIKVELPEVKKEDVKVSINEDVLTITGERVRMKEEKGKKLHRVERFYGTFARSFAIPEDAEPTKLLAEFKEGILKIHLPKSERAKPKNVEIVVA